MRPRNDIRTCRPVRPALTFLTAVLVLAGAAAPALTDVVYLKDGHALHGKVRREADMIVDPVTGQNIPIIKSSNFFIVDDRVRWIIFGHRNVQDADPDTNIRADHLEFLNPITFPRPNNLPSAARMDRVTPLDADWQRSVYLLNQDGQRYQIRQRLTSLSPHAARIESTSYRWNAHYLTQELGPEVVRGLLASHADLRETAGPDIERRMKKFRFFLQAGWLMEAETELDRALADLPAEKDRIERSRGVLRQAQLRALWDETQRAFRAGRYDFVRDVLRRLPPAELEPKMLHDVSTLKEKVETRDRQLAEAKRLLGVMAGTTVGPPRPAFAAALAAIRAEIHPDNVERLDAFLTIAGQFEKDLKAGKSPPQHPEDVLALAVSGWVLGGVSAEAKVETAERYWAGRETILDYLRDVDAGARKRRLEEYQRYGPLGLDEITQLVALLPPPEPPAKSALATAPAPAGGFGEHTTRLPFSQNRSVQYLLQLPPEYHAGRSYPVLIVLHTSGETPAQALARWAPEAARRGFIAAAPLWVGLAGGYNYSPDEHVAATEVVRDLRRLYQVDSDRVFLAGYGDGATMAIDVGFSHPDLFAGIIPINGRPRWAASSWYWRNAQYLPYYIVTGELAGDTTSMNRRIFENWVRLGYPSLMTIYKGRPMEFYQAEVPAIFDWMERQRRATGFPQLGRGANQGTQGEEFQTMRAEDNRFYWITAEKINDKYLNNQIGQGKLGNPAAIQATVRDGNQIVISSRGVRTLRVWLGRVWDAQNGARSMIDFSKPVRIQVNRSMAGSREQKITPSLETMLEDLHLRGDRQRLFMAYVELTNLQ